MRKLARWSVNMCIIATFVVAVMLTLVVSLALVPNANLSANAAPLSESTVADLGGNGLVLGNNSLQTTEENFYVQAVDATGSYNFESSNSLMVKGNVKVVTKPMVKPGTTLSNASLDQNARVYYGLLDPDISTKFLYSCNMRAMNVASAFTVTLKVYYANDNSENYIPADPDGKLDGAGNPAPYIIEDTITVDAPQDTWNAYRALEIEIQNTQLPMDGAHFHVEMSIDSGDTPVYIEDSAVLVTAISKQMSIDTNNDVTLTISGANRKTQTITNVIRNKEQLSSVYVKEGDIISIVTAAEKYDGDAGSSRQEYSPYFAAAMGRMRKTCIDWHTYADAGYGTNNTYLQQQNANVYSPDDVSDQEGIYAYYGYKVTFKVMANVANARTLSIIPRFVSSYDGSVYSYHDIDNDTSIRETRTIVLNVDGTKPTSPIIDSTSGFGKAISEKKWYTDASSFTLDYEYTPNMDSYEVANEQVYAFIVNESYLTYVDGYDFTPVDGIGSNMPELEYKIGNETFTARRQQLGAYNNDNVKEKNKLTFDLQGEYGLVLFAVDAAGNVSTPTVYSANSSRGTVKVDSRTKGAGIHIKYQDETIVPMPGETAETNFTKYARVYVYAGSNYHTEDGVCTQPVNAHITNLSAVRNLVGVKRGSWVTVRIVMDKDQAYNYSLVRVNLDYANFQSSVLNYEIGSLEERIYSFTFQTNDELWANRDMAPDVAISAFFHRRVEIELLEKEFTFTFDKNSSAAKNIIINENDANLKATFPDGTEPAQQPKMDVTYYKPIKFEIRSEYRIQGGNTFLEGDAAIYIDGVRYEVLNSAIDLTAFARGEIPFETGEHRYYCDLSTRSEAYTAVIEGRNLYIFTVTGYDINAGVIEGFKDAGTYYFLAKVKEGSSLNYYGELFSTYTIKKADPGVIKPEVDKVLIYGQGLDEISFVSYEDEQGRISIRPEGANVMTIGTNTYVRVSTNLFGRYVIEKPAIGENLYINPPVSEAMEIAVKFIPVDLAVLQQYEIAENFVVLQNFFHQVLGDNGTVIYVLNEGMRCATNYEEVSFILNVVVAHRDAIVYADESSLSHSYDGFEKEVSASAYLSVNGNLEKIEEEVPYIFEYKLITEGEGSYTTVKPTNAGDYNVRIRIDESKCNYKSESVTEAVLRISKRVLNISIKEDSVEHEMLVNPVIPGESGIEASEKITYTYSYAQTPSFDTYTAEYVQVTGMLFSYSFYKYAYYAHGLDHGLNEDDLTVYLTTFAWTEKVDVIGASSLDAGLYLMAANIENDNNQGTKYFIVDVKQVRRGGEASLQINAPSTRKNYEAVGLNGSKLSAQMEYGQTLESIQADIIYGGGANYMPKGAVNTISISSRFKFETEEQYLTNIKQSDPGATLDVNGFGEYVLPVIYHEDGRVKSYSITIYWQAGVYAEDGKTFVPNYNFRTEALQLEIIVARAKPDFSGYSLNDITFGQTIEDANALGFKGEITSYGYTFKASDFTLTVPESAYSMMPEGGDNIVRCIFTPSEKLLSKYLPIDNVQIALKVNKRAVDIGFNLEDVTTEDWDGDAFTGAVTYTYGGLKHENPITLITPIGIDGLSTSSVVPSYTYYRDYTVGETLLDGEIIVEIDGKEYIQMVGISTSTPVGKYYVKAEIPEADKNFEGSAFEEYFIIRGKLYWNGKIPTKSIQYSENINSVDFGTVTVINDELGNGNVSFRGTVKVAVQDAEGNYIYDYFPEVTLNENDNVVLIFTPSGAQAVQNDYALNYRPYIVPYFLRVDKRDISDTFEVEGLNRVFNNETYTVTVSIPNPINPDEQLAYNVEYFSDCKYAGTHDVLITLDENISNYTGALTVTMVIEKAPLTILDEVVTHTYNAKEFNYVPNWEVGITAYKEANFHFDVKYLGFTYFETTTPVAVGRYYAEVTLDDANFKAEKTVTLLVEPSFRDGNGEVVFIGLNQTYVPPTSDDAIKPVAPKLNRVQIGTDLYDHPSVNYTVRYKEVGTPEDNYTLTVPENAGSYDVILNFNEYGYDLSFNLTMVINKLNVESDFYLEPQYTRVYTGEEVLFAVPLPDGVTVGSYTYRIAGSSDEYTSVKPVNAGLYEVEITLIDNNYFGIGHTKLKIDKATPRIDNLPVLSQNVPFSSQKEDVKFNVGSGIVVFPSTGEHLQEKGKWVVTTDIYSFRVGEHNVSVDFVPNDTLNFNNATTTVNIRIIERDISEFIGFTDELNEDGVYSFEYIMDKIELHPFIKEEANIISGYGNVMFEVLYDGVPQAPTDVKQNGYYNVSVIVSDPNHSGEISGIKMEITHATPVVKFPVLNSIDINDIPDDNRHIVGDSGAAYIALNGKIIPGTFTFREESKVPLTKANAQPVVVQFIPNDTQNVQGVYRTLYINVNGNDTEIDVERDISITSTIGTVYYGAPLRVFDIELIGSQEGTVEWVNPDFIPNVGEKVQFKYTPVDTTVNNIMIIDAEVEILPSEMLLNPNASLSKVILYEGNSIDKADVQLSLLNASYTGIEVSDYKTVITSEFSGIAGAEYVGKYLPSVASITVSHPNYQTTTLVLEVFVMRKITSFHVQNTYKLYDGIAVEKEDLGISIMGGLTQLDANDFAITDIKLNGETVTEIRETGTYSITVIIDEESYVGEDQKTYYGSHAGTHTFTYTISKRDISSSVTVSGNETVYADGSIRLEASFGEYVVDNSTIVYTYFSADKNLSYNQLAPTDAGEYIVLVSLNNPYYTASKEFTYTVKKSTASITLDANYTFKYIDSTTSPVNIVPIVSNNVESRYLTWSYSPVGGVNTFPQKPINVGTYNATVTITGHKNLSGSASTVITILKASVNLVESPQVGSIPYGVELQNARITGGRVFAIENASLELEGKFVFATPEEKGLAVGKHNVTLLFVPLNENYATLELTAQIEITIAELGIEFLSLSKDYTGSPVYPDIKTNVQVSYSFSKDGNVSDTAVDVGEYTVTVRIVDDNYKGEVVRTFQINKAKAIEEESVLPTVAPIAFGSALGNGKIGDDGKVVYLSGQGAVYGTWSYVDKDKPLGNKVGFYNTEIIFTPFDVANYEHYIAVITVEVVKAKATISVSGNTFTYGDVILDPIFTTSPLNLKINNLDFENTMKHSIQPVGIHSFVARIDDENYEGEYEYPIEITKKIIDVAFYNNNSVTDDYRIVYGTQIRPVAKVKEETLVSSDALNAGKYNSNILYTYTNVVTGYTSVTAPNDVGEYVVTAVLTDNNYIINTEVNTISYTIVKAEVSSIEFDANSLSNQIYGEVSIPTVLTTPSNVQYRVEFPSYDSMPTNQGEYTIRVVITDPNYVSTVQGGTFRINPRPISLEELKAYNKAYDGLSDVEVTGKLKGIMNGDEVDVVIKAHTRDNLTNIGVHAVVISECKLKGLHATNYTLRDPLYNLTVKITNKKISDPNSQGYITSSEGFSDNITVSFKEVYDEIDQTNWFTRLLGQKASVQTITVKENGLNTVLETPVKFYVLIPEEFRDAESLTYEGIGSLAGVSITREGNDYISFYASTSGEIVFYKNDFPYWIVIVGGVVIMIILGVVFTLISAPARKRKHIDRPIRQAIEWNDSLAGREHAYKKKVEQEVVERKRRWRY